MGGLYLAIFSAVLGMLQYGFGIGVINTPQALIEAFITASFQSRYGVAISPSTARLCFSIAVTGAIVGGLVGALVGGAVADKYGRKKGLTLAQVPSLLGSVFMGVSKVASSYELLLAGRILFGFSCGLFTALSPMYVSEIAPVKIRGAIGTVNQLAVTSGILISMVLGLSNVLGTETGWPILLAMSAVPAAVQLAILPFMPESPNFLINTLQDQDAGKASLTKLHGANNVQSMLDDIISDDTEESMGIWSMFKQKPLRLPLFVCICLHLSQQLSGMVAIFYYSTDFFQKAGLDKDTSQYATLGVGAIMVTMTFITIPLMDRLGRRLLHLTGLGGIMVCSICITVAQSLNSSDSNGIGIFLIVVTLTFVAFFAFGPGSIPWMAASEIFTQNVRGPATSVCVFVNWLGNLIVGLAFPQLQTAIPSYSFLPFLVITAVLFAILFYYFPETKGLSPAEIQEIFQTQNAWSTPIGLKSKQKTGLMTSSQNPPLYGAVEAEATVAYN